jgi:hypothetical protein
MKKQGAIVLGSGGNGCKPSGGAKPEHRHRTISGVMGRASIILVAQGGVYPMIARIFPAINRASRSS